jgi:hypothetical protein
MNEPYVALSKVIAALKQEGLRRKARAKDIIDPASTASTRTKPTPPVKNPNQATKRCKFCNVEGHDLNNCFNTAKIIRDYKARRGQSGKDSSENTKQPKGRSDKPHKPAVPPLLNLGACQTKRKRSPTTPDQSTPSRPAWRSVQCPPPLMHH